MTRSSAARAWPHVVSGDKKSQPRVGIAGRTPRLYSPGMLLFLRSRCAGWTSAMVLSFSVAMLAFSVSGMGVTHAFTDTLHAKSASETAAHAAPAHPCDQCGGRDHDMSIPACSAVCAGAVAVLSAPALPAILEVVRIGALPISSPPSSHNDPPDPYPPRPAIL